MDIKPIQKLRTLAITVSLLMTALHTAAQEIPVLTPWGTPYSWLHKGLNLQLDLGATIGFGKHNPYRNGAFYTDISALYLTQCGDPKLWVAAGAALSHTRLAGESYINGSLGLTAAYQLNERLTALAAVAYTTPPLGATPRHACLPYPCSTVTPAAMRYMPGFRSPYFYPDMRMTPGMSVTGGVDYKVTETFHIGVSATWSVVNDNAYWY
ncbi:MAG: hypothetical protein SO064_01740 [Prevotella sp.]|nr:hypothetical protein [Prevotella sp.]